MTDDRSTRPGSPLAGLFGVFAGLGVTARTVSDYWRQERRTIALGLTALFVAALADLAAGLTLGSAEARLAALPGILVLIPAAIAMRGATFGALGARLGTAIHTGLFEATLERGGYLRRQVQAVTVLTLVTSVEAAVLAKVFSQAMGLAAAPLWDLVVVSVVGGVLASIILLFVTLSLARTAFNRGWDMDDVGAPTITATGDLLAIPALLLAASLTGLEVVTEVIAVVSIVATLVALVVGWRDNRQDVRTIVRESTLVLTGAAAVSVLAGIVIGTREDLFLATPALLVLFPPFVALFGSLGGILSSRLTSKLHLGLIEPRAMPRQAAALDFSLTFLFAVVIYAFVGVTTWAASSVAGFNPPPLPQLVAVAMLGGLMGTALLSAIAYTAATATFRFGLDPDNHAIPIVTSVMDFLGMLCLVAALAIVGVS